MARDVHDPHWGGRLEDRRPSEDQQPRQAPNIVMGLKDRREGAHNGDRPETMENESGD